MIFYNLLSLTVLDPVVVRTGRAGFLSLALQRLNADDFAGNAVFGCEAVTRTPVKTGQLRT